MNDIKLISQYKQSKSHYHKFALRINKILKSFMKDLAIFKYQDFQKQKTEKSLTEKIKTRKNIKNINDINDLSRCRFIFYSEEDVKIFRKKIYEEFDVVGERTGSITHRIKSPKTFFISVKLKKEILNIPENREFKNMKCEIHFTTMFCYAWSELQHDIIYKPPKEMKKYYKKDLGILEKEFFDIMIKHVIPGQKKFNDIIRKFQSLNKKIKNEQTINRILEKRFNYYR